MSDQRAGKRTPSAERPIEFDAEIETSEKSRGGAWVTIPFDVEEVW